LEITKSLYVEKDAEPQLKSVESMTHRKIIVL
jgi:hypothetical protein